ncbi:MAG: NAD(P)H-dependent glycerol-3-phosphate dehydrogenase [Thermoanaerobaculales bacterium]|jgi:glycerol-3-phosphate dehydrogenase (NAD(P)+)|nr:NAD(P)H-dependent glycerol-3-phosphate dehydrogenase [Thermoanaerobaculales bacterium]
MEMTVFGGGSWGCALAHQMARRGHDVLLWAFEAEVAAGINADHRNPVFLTDAELHPAIRCTNDLEEAAGHAAVWIWVVPVQFSRDVMERLAPHLREEVVVVSASKGIETESLKRMDEVGAEALGIPDDRFCCLSGPTFAIGVVHGDPSAAVLACREIDTACRLQEEFSDHYLRCYAGGDLIGVELAGALKNVVAIAAGIIDGLGLGANTQAALMTRGLHEITRLGVALGAQPDTFRGLAGMGDLVLTSTSALSRNRQVGQRMGRGESLVDILGSMREVAEGVKTTPAAATLAENLEIEMPITQAMTAILQGRIAPADALKALMTRQLKVETQL